MQASIHKGTASSKSAISPLTHLLKDNVPGVSSRHIDSLILLCMLAVTLAAYPASQGGGDFDWSKSK